MPLAKIHVIEGRYDEARIAKVSDAIQAALMSTLRVPPDHFYQLIFEMPKKPLLHTPSFVGMHYTDNLITLDLTTCKRAADPLPGFKSRIVLPILRTLRVASRPVPVFGAARRQRNFPRVRPHAVSLHPFRQKSDRMSQGGRVASTIPTTRTAPWDGEGFAIL
jgi:hypothetical protein